MPIDVLCACGKRFETPDGNAGRRSACPECGKGLVIPRRSAVRPVDAETDAQAVDLNAIDAYQPPASGLAVASLALGVLSLAFSLVAGIPAVVVGVLGLREIRSSRGRLRGASLAGAGILLGSVGSTAVTFLVIMPYAWRALDQVRLSECETNMQAIVEAIRGFEHDNGRLPPQATRDAQGRPILSWRVAILPYLGPEAETLARKFHHDEPWDAPHNAALLQEMPAAYRCPSHAGAGGFSTGYQVVVNPGGLFTGKRSGVPLSSMTDEAFSTLLFAESTRAVPWSSPEDVMPDAAGNYPTLGSRHAGRSNFAFADGSISDMPGTIPPGVLRAFITRAGGEVIKLP